MRYLAFCYGRIYYVEVHEKYGGYLVLCRCMCSCYGTEGGAGVEKISTLTSWRCALSYIHFTSPPDPTHPA